ncbi:hypothetical protein DMZ43_00375 [Meridianimaribacter sp. CL38]|uniref:hypothetical protein n=1 Tax=Meridianimaribacter sp. CL38 TaxID=2213021 RepID=UPI00103F0218|nr:hypothetical protein [Meridianimaribacter sp. CL38]TBV27549.1 hypothetical protein DMZ43_00375 [Meridianimaribacter sp. CL38]
MKENENKYVEAFTDKVLKDTKLESPSFDFTDAVMSQVEAIQYSKATRYKPLISKPVWVVISIGFLSFVAYLLFQKNTKSSSEWFTNIDFSLIFDNALAKLFSNLQFSNIFVYAMLLFAIMLCVQISWLKNYFDKRLSV